MTAHSELCEHVQPGTWPFEVELVIDEQLGFTDALVSCRRCGAHYLLEMLDWRGHHRLMRVATVASERVRALLHDLGRGSCDPKRAGASVEQVQAGAAFTPWLLLLDARAMRIEAIRPVPNGRKLPTVSWRALPCDGSWIADVMSAG